MSQQKKERVRRDPTVFESALAMIIMMVMVSYVIMGGKGDAQMPFVAATAIASLIALRTGKTWAELEAGIVNAISAAIQSIIIIMVIGMVVGSWIQGGVVPAMIYYGLKIINPDMDAVERRLKGLEEKPAQQRQQARSKTKRSCAAAMPISG